MGPMNEYAISVIRQQQREQIEYFYRLMAFEALFRRYWVLYNYEDTYVYTV